MEKVLNAINESEKETELEKRTKQEEIFRWCNEVDLMKLIESFGYTGQTEIAKVMKVPQSFLSMLSRNKYDRYVPNMKIVYDFFHDDFNKKKQPSKLIVKPISEEVRQLLNSPDDAKKIIDWYGKVDGKKLMKKYGFKTSQQLADAVGISKTSAYLLINSKLKNISPNAVKLYQFFKELEQDKKIDKTDDVIKVQKTQQEEQKEEVNINTSEDSKTIVDEAKNVESEDVKQETPKEENNSDEVKVDKKKVSRKTLKKRIRNLKDENTLNVMQINALEIKIHSLTNENARLRKQLERYEKLIDRL